MSSNAVGVGLDALRVNPLRTVLSTLGVIIGVASLVAVLSLGDGMENALRSQIAATTDVQSIAITARSFEEVDGQFFPIPEPTVLTAGDARALRALDGVDGVVLGMQALGEVRLAEGEGRRIAAVAAEVAMRDTGRTQAVIAGRALTPDETAGDAAVVSLSAELARDLAGATDPAAMVGKTVLVSGNAAQVVGILAPIPVGALPQVQRSGRGRAARRDYRVATTLGFARIGTRQQGRGGAGLVVHARRVEDVDAVKRRVEGFFAARDTAWARRISLQTSERRIEQAATGILVFKLSMGAITGISLLVGGIGIMNVLLASVTERTREIGIRKATGARRRDILVQFLSESVAISGAGSAIGAVLGVSGAFTITALIRRFANAPLLQASFSWSTLLVAASSAILVGLIFGTYPARRAAKLSPIEAIRHE
jgi:putative ABC transport system permease protein